MTTVTLLDVGHGNCAIVHSNSHTVVIDCPTGTLLIDTLRDMRIDHVDAAIISHADKDYIAGILSLLTSDFIRVERIYVNPDSQKASKVWRDFRVAVAVAERKGGCEVVTSLSSTAPGAIPVGAATITVVSPTAALALAGVGGKTLNAQTVTSNTLSGVLRVGTKNCENGVLLAGDMDEVSLDNSIAAGTDLTANVLVFPHHGGLPGTADPSTFARKLLDAVEPRSVIFSNGRGRHDNPRPDIVAPVRERGCAIACTQLSERCQKATIVENGHLEPIRAQGKLAGSCCAGSVTLALGSAVLRIPGADDQHQNFITEAVATPMCRMVVQS
jgi:beta-lactamase superfamily II metal-dependent hydrolase